MKFSALFPWALAFCCTQLAAAEKFPQFFEQEYTANELVLKTAAAGEECTCESPEQRALLLSQIQAALQEEERHVVQKGQFMFFNLSSCEHDTKQGCFFQNPSSRYGVLDLPPSPHEPKHTNTPQGAFLGGGWRLAKDEVVLVYGCTPPESQYYAFTPYITYTYGRGPWRAFTKWHLVFGSVADSANHHRTKTICGTPFNENSLYLLGGNQETIQRVTDVVSRLRPELPVNVIPMPAGDPEWGLKMGVKDDSDLFLLLHRISFPTDREAYNRYLESNPYSVLRVTPRDESAVTQLLFEAPNLISRALPGNEKRLQAAVDFLYKKVEEKVAGPGGWFPDLMPDMSSTVSPLTLMGVDYGLGCYKKMLPCFGDNRDTSYVLNIPPFRLNSDDEIVYFIGVNDKSMGFGEYSSGSVYQLKKQLGVVDFNNYVYEGSADEWLKGTQYEHEAKHLFAYALSYDCKGRKFCANVPKTGFPSLPVGDWAVVISRVYVSPAGVGPDAKDLVLPRQLKVNKPRDLELVM